MRFPAFVLWLRCLGHGLLLGVCQLWLWVGQGLRPAGALRSAWGGGSGPLRPLARPVRPRRSRPGGQANALRYAAAA